MTVIFFNKLITSLFGHEHYVQEKIFYMQVYVAAYKNNELGELYEIIDNIKYTYANPKITIKNPRVYFNNFIDKIKKDFN